MFQDIRRLLAQCMICKAREPARVGKALNPIEIAGPFDDIGLDFAGPQTRPIGTSLLLNKWTEARETIDDAAATTARFVYDVRWFCNRIAVPIS